MIRPIPTYKHRRPPRRGYVWRYTKSTWPQRFVCCVTMFVVYPLAVFFWLLDVDETRRQWGKW